MFRVVVASILVVDVVGEQWIQIFSSSKIDLSQQPINMASKCGKICFIRRESKLHWLLSNVLCGNLIFWKIQIKRILNVFIRCSEEKFWKITLNSFRLTAFLHTSLGPMQEQIEHMREKVCLKCIFKEKMKI